MGYRRRFAGKPLSRSRSRSWAFSMANPDRERRSPITDPDAPFPFFSPRLPFTFFSLLRRTGTRPPISPFHRTINTRTPHARSRPSVFHGGRWGNMLISIRARARGLPATLPVLPPDKDKNEGEMHWQHISSKRDKRGKN